MNSSTSSTCPSLFTSECNSDVELDMSNSIDDSDNNISSCQPVDLDLTRPTSTSLVTQAQKKDEDTVWVVNKGFKTWTGETIVDMIMNFEKVVVYFPKMANCFNQWIALREIHQRGEKKRLNGRVRCAIRISDQVLGPESYTVEQGWKEGSNWIAYKIIAVRKLFSHCFLQQSNEGRPWRVFTNDKYLVETVKLLTAIHRGTTLSAPIVRISHQVGSRTSARKQVTYQKQEEKKEKRQQCSHYQKIIKINENQKKTEYICCEKLMCMFRYKCSITTNDNIPVIQFYRNKFLEFSEATKREFIACRLKNKNVQLNLNTSEFYLENIETMMYYVNQGVVPLQPSCAPQQMMKVCCKFFKFVLQVSSNKLYQPTVEGDFSTVMNIQRNPHTSDFGATDSVKHWLTNYAQAHLHDPSKGNTIILWVPSRMLVYDAYKNDFKNGCLLYFPKKLVDGVMTHYLPSRSWFMYCWRTVPSLQGIVLRKYLRFALCDMCIDFREKRRFATTDAERKEIKKMERIHHEFVHEERGTYYLRREHAVFYPTEFLSLIADGADQSAYGLPRFIEIDKTSSNVRKIPIYLMGVLVHGYRSFGFTYLKNIKHGTNIVIECLHHVLVDYKKNRGYIPPIVYIQLDNTWKQNKNKFMIGYLACLVAWGVVRQVVISFLPVGHTHEDIGKTSCVMSIVKKQGEK